MKLSREQLRSHLKKGDLAPVYLLHGEEDLVIEQITDAILAKALSDEARDFNLDLFHGDDADGAAIVNAALSYPMMSRRRAVVVKSVEALSGADLDLVARYVEKPSPSTCMVLTATKIQKKALKKISDNAFSIESKPLYDSDVPGWIRATAKRMNLAITEDAIRLLHACKGNSLRALASELEKLELNLGDRREIQIKDVEGVVGVDKQFNIFELCDAVGGQDLKRALGIVDRMLQLGESPAGILVMLTRHFILLSKCRILRARGKSDREIASHLRIHSFFIANYIRQAARYQRAQIRSVFPILLEAEWRLKSGNMKPKIVLETLLFKLNRAG